jgi:hypothetical protein
MNQIFVQIFLQKKKIELHHYLVEQPHASDFPTILCYQLVLQLPLCLRLNYDTAGLKDTTVLVSNILFIYLNAIDSSEYLKYIFRLIIFIAVLLTTFDQRAKN